MRAVRRRALSIRIAAPLALRLRDDSSRWVPLETGGVLLGVERDDELEVLELIGGGPGARRERTRFVPDGEWQRQQIADRYAASGRTLAYLGDWHSHPVGGKPSRLDRSTAARIASTPSARCPRPLFIIVTREKGAWVLRGYVYARGRFRRASVRERPERALGGSRVDGALDAL